MVPSRQQVQSGRGQWSRHQLGLWHLLDRLVPELSMLLLSVQSALGRWSRRPWLLSRRLGRWALVLWSLHPSDLSRQWHPSLL